ncbi:MAG: hypothetical protein CBB71_13250 [Rhodopirellula sp. TMED11]|nr:MAG: hypothetical protein CBB71_13250 [Rhodopirellula sp. TMED11]
MLVVRIEGHYSAACFQTLHCKGIRESNHKCQRTELAPREAKNAETPSMAVHQGRETSSDASLSDDHLEVPVSSGLLKMESAKAELAKPTDRRRSL